MSQAPVSYCAGYLADIGVRQDPAPMDFSVWFEAYIGGKWYTFDARHSHPRIGRVVVARGRDAADVAISTEFRQTMLVSFNVVTEEVLVDDAISPRPNEAEKELLAELKEQGEVPSHLPT